MLKTYSLILPIFSSFAFLLDPIHHVRPHSLFKRSNAMLLNELDVFPYLTPPTQSQSAMTCILAKYDVVFVPGQPISPAGVAAFFTTCDKNEPITTTNQFISSTVEAVVDSAHERDLKFVRLV